MADTRYEPILSNNRNKSVASLFEARKFYNEVSIPYITGSYLYPNDDLNYDPNDPENVKNNKIPLSDLYNENALHGVIDLDANIISPINDPSFFREVNIIDGKKLLLQNFVFDAFSDMKVYLDEQVLRNCFGIKNIIIGPDNGINSPFYNMSVKKACFENITIDDLYEDKSIFISSKFKQYCRQDININKNIKTFDDFVKHYTTFLIDHMIVAPVTKSRTQVFYNLKLFTSGLSFSVSDDAAGDYDKNYKKYYMDPAFFTFAKACIRYGFRIDKNNPFILHADLESPAMKIYMKKYNLNNSREVFNNRYRIICLEDLNSLKRFYANSYNNFVNSNSIIPTDLYEISPCDYSSIRLKKRQPLNNNVNEILENRNNLFLRLYVYFKNYELNMNLTQENFEFIVKKATSIINIRRSVQFENTALTFINEYFDETRGVKYFDSLSSKNAVVNSQILNPPKNEIQLWR